MRNKVIRIALRLLPAVVLVAAAAASTGAEVVEAVLVKVNGDIFTKTELEQRQIAVLRQRGQQIDLKSEAGNQQLKQMLDEITPQIMVDVVNEMVVVQRGRELGYKLSDEQFKQVVDNIKKENHIETEQQFQAALTQENMTMDDLRRSLERQMIVSRVQQNEVFGKIGVSEEEARKYYDAHLNEFTTPASVTLREILVAVPNDPKGLNVAADDAAKQKAEELRQRAIKGDSYEKLAADFSDAPSRANAGLIGPISLNDLSPDLRKFIESLKVGAISEVVRTPRGYQIFKLESSTPAQVLPFDQAREQISDRVFTGKRKEEFDRYLAKLRSEAIIEWKNEEVKRAYEQGLKAQEHATAPQP